MAIKEKIEILIEEINNYNYNYYTLDNPTISDFDFDKKLEELEKLEKENPQFFNPNSPTQRVGGGVTKNFKTEIHKNRMYSLDNSYSKEDLFDWQKRVEKNLNTDKIEYVCELKYDGVSINLTYENGNLIKAVTRGDGFQGDNVTKNIKTIRSIPLNIKTEFAKDFEIRGEVILPIEGFNNMNKERVAQGKEEYRNPRNTASGSLKLQDSTEVAKRPLDCLLYQIIINERKYKTHFESIEKARVANFKIPKDVVLAKSMSEVLEFINYWDSKRKILAYETDGVVIKVNDLSQQERLGYTSKSPRWAIAYKFKAGQTSTILEKITYQVGRTGSITPVANLSPVELAGTIVKRASLHNADQIKKLDVRIGDTVFVEKGGDIIPKIISVDLEKRSKNSVPVNFITECLECGTKLKKVTGEANHYCLNEQNCTPQITGRIQHFISRKAMDIDGLGAETVHLLQKERLIENYADLYNLKIEQLIPLERMAEKSAQNMINGIEKSKNKPFEKVLFALGISFVGETVAKKLARKFKTIDNLMSATFDDLIKVDEIGEKIAQSLIDFFSDTGNVDLVNRLKTHGLNFEISLENLANKTNVLEGQIFVISGVFEKMSREELKKSIEENGGKVGSSISSKTNYLIAGNNMGPSKLAKAKNLNINIISEDDFIEIISE